MADKDKTDRAIGWWAALCSVLLIALGGLMIAYIASTQATHAGQRASSISTCINNILGTRSLPTARDSAEQRAWVSSLAAVFVPPQDSPEQLRAYDAFIAETRHFVDVLQADQALRNASPLGKC